MNRYSDSPSFLTGEALKKQIPRIMAVHDISCLGRCALTVIIPVISAMGLQAVPLPTALLSTHTGGFSGMFFEDLTGHMGQIGKHLKSIDTDFDAIYSGFLGSAEQIDVLASLIRDFSCKNDGKKTFVAVDPVMGDDGELYSTYDKSLMLGMSRLCYGADLITPNLTEACFLLGEKYPDHVMSCNEGREIGERLSRMLVDRFGCEKAVVTGIECADGEKDEREKSVITAALIKGETSAYFHSTRLMPRAYPGTGDVFASVLLGKMLMGKDFYCAVDSASEFVSFVTEFSHQFATPIRDGLVIEPCLHRLFEKN